MKRLDRYLLLGFSGAWVAALVFFMGMYLVIHFFNKMANLSDTAENFRAIGLSPLLGFCRYYALNLPFILVEIAPFTVLMACMWAVQQMSRRNELVPVLVGGISFRRLALPLLVTGFLITLGFAAVREEVLPRLAAERHQMERVFRGKEDDFLKDLPLLEDGEGHLLLIRAYDVQRSVAHHVTVRKMGNPASEGGWAESLGYRQEGPGGPGWYPVEGTRVTGDLEVPMAAQLQPRDIEIEARSLLFMSVGDLRRLLKRHPGKSSLEVLLHAHFAYPLRTVVLLLLGLPLVLKGTRRSPYVAVGLSLLVSVGFFAVQSIVEELGRRGEILNPVLGAWLPIILFGSLGLLVFETMPT